MLYCILLFLYLLFLKKYFTFIILFAIKPDVIPIIYILYNKWNVLLTDKITAVTLSAPWITI